jgi:type I restriction enzyme R subunit
MSDFNEYKFEQELCEALESNGWLYSKSDAGYDSELALFPADVIAWLVDSQSLELRMPWFRGWQSLSTCRWLMEVAR